MIMEISKSEIKLILRLLSKSSELISKNCSKPKDLNVSRQIKVEIKKIIKFLSKQQNNGIL